LTSTGYGVIGIQASKESMVWSLFLPPHFFFWLVLLKTLLYLILDTDQI